MTSPFVIAHGTALAVIASLLGAGVALELYANTYPPGTPRWDQLMHLGYVLNVISGSAGIAWVLIMNTLVRIQQRRDATRLHWPNPTRLSGPLADPWADEVEPAGIFRVGSLPLSVDTWNVPQIASSSPRWSGCRST